MIRPFYLILFSLSMIFFLSSINANEEEVNKEVMKMVKNTFDIPNKGYRCIEKKINDNLIGYNDVQEKYIHSSSISLIERGSQLIVSDSSCIITLYEGEKEIFITDKSVSEFNYSKLLNTILEMMRISDLKVIDENSIEGKIKVGEFENKSTKNQFFLIEHNGIFITKIIKYYDLDKLFYRSTEFNVINDYKLNNDYQDFIENINNISKIEKKYSNYQINDLRTQ